ncbi:MAG: hypothetical protein ACYDEF_16295 [Methanosarcina sp.]|nr:hypothetical protein BGV40_15850 [Methanosarcina sp. Ant1]
MEKQTFARIIKVLSFLLLIFFIMFLTAASAGAKNVYVPCDYQVGSQAGAQYGYKVGYDAGYKDCLKYGLKGVLTKIPVPDIKDEWTNNYKRGYIESFKKEYIEGYHDVRFACLKE